MGQLWIVPSMILILTEIHHFIYLLILTLLILRLHLLQELRWYVLTIIVWYNFLTVLFLKPGGLTFREGAFVCEYLAETNRLCSMDITEVNPLLEGSDQVELTTDMGKRMVSCALGEALLWGKQNHFRSFDDSLP